MSLGRILIEKLKKKLYTFKIKNTSIFNIELRAGLLMVVIRHVLVRYYFFPEQLTFLMLIAIDNVDKTSL